MSYSSIRYFLDIFGEQQNANIVYEIKAKYILITGKVSCSQSIYVSDKNVIKTYKTIRLFYGIRKQHFMHVLTHHTKQSTCKKVKCFIKFALMCESL